MSVEDRRNSLRKSSIGIDSIRKSITKLNEGLIAIGNNSRELLKQTRKTNQLKSKLIRQDGEFFKRRRENALRKQREDELEASTITGVTKRQGSLTQKSTRGFLGRILDFVGILILGWALTNLPKIISAFQKLFGFIRRTVGILTGFISGIKNFLVGIGTGIDNFLDIFRRFNFAEDDKNIRDTFESTQNNLTKLSNEFYEGAQAFAKDKDIASAEKVAEDIGVFEANDISEDKSQQEAKKIEDEINAEIDKTLEEGGEQQPADDTNVEGVDTSNVEAGFFTEPTDEDIEREIALDAEEDAIQGEQTLSDEGITGDADDIEGMGGEDDESIIPASSGGGVPKMSAGGGGGGLELDLDEEKTTKFNGVVTPVKKTDSKSITPIKVQRNNVGKNRRKKTKIIKLNKQEGTSTGAAPSFGGGTKTKIVEIGKSSEKLLSDLMSLNNKHN